MLQRGGLDKSRRRRHIYPPPHAGRRISFLPRRALNRAGHCWNPDYAQRVYREPQISVNRLSAGDESEIHRLGFRPVHFAVNFRGVLRDVNARRLTAFDSAKFYRAGRRCREKDKRAGFTIPTAIAGYCEGIGLGHGVGIPLVI